MALRMQHRIGGGAYSDVFRDPESGRVYKLFKRRLLNVQLGEDHGEHEPALRRSVFNAERDAYGIAMGIPAIRPFVPTFHGVIGIDQAIDLSDGDISDRYLLDCCYVLDLVDGEPVDLTHNLVAQHDHLHDVIAAFEANGINHWADGSVFHPDVPARTRIIDFATADGYHDGEMALILAE